MAYDGSYSVLTRWQWQAALALLERDRLAHPASGLSMLAPSDPTKEMRVGFELETQDMTWTVTPAMSLSAAIIQDNAGDRDEIERAMVSLQVTAEALRHHLETNAHG